MTCSRFLPCRFNTLLSLCVCVLVLFCSFISQLYSKPYADWTIPNTRAAIKGMGDSMVLELGVRVADYYKEINKFSQGGRGPGSGGQERAS